MNGQEWEERGEKVGAGGREEREWEKGGERVGGERVGGERVVGERRESGGRDEREWVEREKERKRERKRERTRERERGGGGNWVNRFTCVKYPFLPLHVHFVLIIRFF